MRVSKFIISLAIQLILLANIFAQSKSEPYFFIQLTEPQFGMFENNKNFDRETILYEKAIVGINKLEPDFVIITGDFVHDKNSEAQINEFKRLTAKINPDILVYYSSGNHDLGKTPDKQSLKKYLDLFAENGVDVVFTGHHHNNILNAYGEVQLVTTSAAGKSLGDAPSGMRIIKVYTDKIEHEYFGFDELPESVRFE